jgi:hypothetical protein
MQLEPYHTFSSLAWFQDALVFLKYVSTICKHETQGDKSLSEHREQACKPSIQMTEAMEGWPSHQAQVPVKLQQ